MDELVDAVIGEVEALETRWERGRKDLKSCSLVSRTFRHPSQRRLFRSATIGTGRRVWFAGQKHPKEIMSGLARTPHLASYVRDLDIEIAEGDYIQLREIFPLLTGVTRVEIAAFDSMSESWYRDSPPFFRVALRSFLTIPSLQCLAFRCDGIPTSLILYALASFKAVALNP